MNEEAGSSSPLFEWSEEDKRKLSEMDVPVGSKKEKAVENSEEKNVVSGEVSGKRLPGKPFWRAIELAKGIKDTRNNSEMLPLREAMHELERNSKKNVFWNLVPDVIKGEVPPVSLFAVAGMVDLVHLVHLAIAMRDALKTANFRLDDLIEMEVAVVRGSKDRERITYNIGIDRCRDASEKFRERGQESAAGILMRAVVKAEEEKAKKDYRRAKAANKKSPEDSPVEDAPSVEVSG